MRLHSDRLVEWFSSIVLIGWAVVLMQPGDTLSASNFREFLRYGFSEEAIAGSFALVGGARCAALYINGRWPRTPLIRMVGSALGCMLWAQVAWMLYANSLATGSAITTGVAVYLPLAAFDLVSIFRAAFDARYHGH